MKRRMGTGIFMSFTDYDYECKYKCALNYYYSSIATSCNSLRPSRTQ